MIREDLKKDVYELLTELLDDNRVAEISLERTINDTLEVIVTYLFYKKMEIEK